MSNVLTTASNAVERPRFKDQYENYIGGKWTPPVRGEYFENTSPVDGQVFTRIPKSTEEDINLAIDAAWAAAPQWNNSSATYRSNLLLKMLTSWRQTLKY